MTVSLPELAEQARAHAKALTADINNATTRAETIRLSILALEAERLANNLELVAQGSRV